ncbi:hypothetical protein [Azospirillum lipoferum]|uniref:hypothetical protein n=1 Tax=Azospirillum lipoferum TaxID=193 RepID=UPI001395FB95|nr:hypothetical protein [Azospirillum lipoferum]
MAADLGQVRFAQNLADKARQMGVPIWRFGEGGLIPAVIDDDRRYPRRLARRRPLAPKLLILTGQDQEPLV